MKYILSDCLESLLLAMSTQENPHFLECSRIMNWITVEDMPAKSYFDTNTKQNPVEQAVWEMKFLGLTVEEPLLIKLIATVCCVDCVIG